MKGDDVRCRVWISSKRWGHTSALVKELHGVLGDGQEVSNVLVSSEDLNKCVASRFKRQPWVLIKRWRRGERTPLICAVKDDRSSSFIVCDALLPTVPLTAILPPLAAKRGPDDLEDRRDVTS